MTFGHRNEGFNRVSDPQLRKQMIGKANKLDAPPVAAPEKTGTSKGDLMTSLSAIRKKGTPITKMEEVDLDEISKEKAMNYIDKSAAEFGDRRADLARGKYSNENFRKVDNRYRGILQASGKLAGKRISGVKVPANEDVEDIQETLPASASASDYIHDFVHSKNKVFKGDTKKKRIKRALGAFYHKKKEE